jgi:hypothetical protein
MKRKRNKKFWLSKLFSRLHSNFEKPEGPPHTGRSFQNKNHVLRKVELGSIHKIQRKNWTGLSEP